MDVNIVVDLDDYITSPDDIIKLGLIKRECRDCNGSWQIMIYEVYKNDKPEDYVHESRPNIETIREVWRLNMYGVIYDVGIGNYSN